MMTDHGVARGPVGDDRGVAEQGVDDRLNGMAPALSPALPYADRIMAVRFGDIAIWLHLGWRDLTRSPVASLTYGAAFLLIGIGLAFGLRAIDMFYLLTPLTAGFLLVGPALAVGVYDLSRRQEQGEPATLIGAVLAFRRNAFHILTAGLVLMLFLMIWLRLAVLVFALFFPFTSMSWASVGHQILTLDGLTFMAVGTLVGGVLAAMAFVASAVSLPLMLEHRTDIFTAALVSALAVFGNLPVMIAWAACIVVITTLGLVSLVGLVVAVPLLGHATWHAYRSLVRWPAT